METVYFELNNWFPGTNYPDAEPFVTWCDDENLIFADEEFVKTNRLCVVEQVIDMSVNWCITAPKEFVEKFCPKLLSDETIVTKFEDGRGNVRTETHSYREYLRFPNEDGKIIGDFGAEFLEWSENNIGIHYIE